MLKTLISLLLMTTLIAAGECKRARAAEVTAPTTSPTGDWQLQFQDDFGRPNLSERWAVLEGNWYVRDGRLQGVGQILCAHRFSGSVRVEYDARSNDPGDLSAILCANDKGLRGGYFFGFGSNGNAYGKLLIKAKEAVRHGGVIKAGKIHHVVCQREGYRLTQEVNGEVVLNYVDPTPLAGADHARVGLYISRAGEIDNVKVYTRPETFPSDPPREARVVFVKPLGQRETPQGPFGYEPQHDQVSEAYVTPHTPWAKPYAKGVTRLLCIAPMYGHRDTVELAQRLEIEYDVVMTQSWTALGSDKAKLRRNHHVGREPQRVAQRLREALAKPHDVIVVGGIDWDILPQELRTELLEQVKAGSGLVVRTLPGHTQKLMRLIEGAEPVHARHLVDHGVPFTAVPIWSDYSSDQEAAKHLVATLRYGNGRVAVLKNFVGWGNTGYLTPADPVAMRTTVWDLDYSFSLVIRAILWAAGKEPDLDLRCTLTDSHGQPISAIAWQDLNAARLSVKVNGPDHKPKASLRVAVRDLRDDLGTPIYVKTIAMNATKRPGDVSVPMKNLPAGRYLIDVIARQGNRSLDWFSVPLEVTSAQRIAQTTIDKRFMRPGGEVTLAIDLAKPAASGTQWVCRTTDCLGRLVKVTSVHMPQGTSAARTTLSIEHPRATLLTLRSDLVVDGQTIDARVMSLPIRYPPGVDDFSFMAWSTKNFDPAGRHLPKVMYDVGFDVAFIAKDSAVMGKSVRRFAAANLRVVPYATYYASHKTNGEPPHRVPCLSDPKFLETERQKLVHIAQQIMPFGPVGYNLGDEATLGDGAYDLCFSPSCRAAFREFARNTYGTLDALNAEWQTAYGSWDQIEPITIDQAQQTNRFAPWADFRTSMENVFAGILRADSQALRTVDETAISGIEHLGRAMSFNGKDWWKLTRATKYLSSTYYLSNEMLRCFSTPGSYVGRFVGGYRGLHRYEAYCRWAPWFGLFHGQNSVWWYTHYSSAGYGASTAAIAPDLTPFPIATAMGEEVGRIRRGIYELLSGCRRDHGGIAILESQPSIHASTVDSSLVTVEESQRAFANTIEDIGLQYDFISTSQLSEGILSQRAYQVLILPCAQALSASEKRTIMAFVRAGGLLVADVRPGVMNEHCRYVTDKNWDDLFGIGRSVHRPGAPIAKGNIRLEGSLRERSIAADLQNMTADAAVTPKAAKVFGRCGGAPAFVVNESGNGLVVLFNFVMPRKWWELDIEWYGMLGQRARAANRRDPRRAALRDVLAAVLKAGGVQAGFEISGQAKRPGPVFLGEVMLYRSGQAAYLCLIRDPISPVSPPDLQSDTVTISLPAPTTVHDILAARSLGRTTTIRKTLASGEVAVYALLPFEVLLVEVQTDAPTYQVGKTVVVTVNVRATRDRSLVTPPGEHVTGRQVVHVDVLDPAGQAKRHYARNLVARGGRVSMVIPLALNDPVGPWTVRANDVATGIAGMARFQVNRAGKR